MPPKPFASPFAPICSSCRLALRRQHQRRSFSDTRRFRQASLTQTTCLPPQDTPAYFNLTNRRLISLTGHDAAHFLQGLVTSNVTSQVQRQGGSGFFSVFLNAAGRVLHDVFVYPVAGARSWRNATGDSAGDDGFVIEVDANEVGSLVKHLKRYKLRARLDIRVLDQGEWGVWSTWDPSRNLERQSHAVNGIRCVDGRAPGVGSRHILPVGQQPQVDGEKVQREAYDLRRMLLGVPEGQAEIIKDTALPLEANLDYMGGIDFRKGCYVGQELTIRTHHTGVVRKRILPVQLYGPDDGVPESLAYDEGSRVELPPSGTNISRKDKKGRSTGKWIGGVGNIGLALCRLEVMTDTVLTGEGSQWKPSDDFQVEWEGKKTFVKAFVPEWHKERAEAQTVQRH